MPDLLTPLNALRDALERSSLVVWVGHPAEAGAASAQVCLLPWHLSEAPAARLTSLPTRGGAGASAPNPVVSLNGLLLPGASGDVNAFGRAFAALRREPVLTTPQGVVRVLPLALEAAVLAQLLSAAQLRLGLSAAFEMQFSLDVS